jgi:hypothetical protein
MVMARRSRRTALGVGSAALSAIVALLVTSTLVLAADPWPGTGGRRPGGGGSAEPTLDRVTIELVMGVPDAELDGTWQMDLALFAFAPSWTPGSALARASLTIEDFACQGGGTADPADDVLRDIELLGRPTVELTGEASPGLQGTSASGTLTFTHAAFEDPCPPGSDALPFGTFEAPLELALTGRGRVTMLTVDGVLRLSREMGGRVLVDGRPARLDRASMSREIGWS